jgi:hypothetical protein
MSLLRPEARGVRLFTRAPPPLSSLAFTTPTSSSGSRAATTKLAAHEARSSSTPEGPCPRFVRDEDGKLVRNKNVGGGDGGRGRGARGGREAGGRGGGGRGGSSGSARLVNASITSAARPEDILSVVTANLHELNHVNVSTAFNRLGKMAKWRDLSSRRLTADDGFQELLRLARDCAENMKFDPQHVANTTHGIAKLHEAGRLCGSVDDTLAALESDVVRMAPKMTSQSVANTVYAFSVLGLGEIGSAGRNRGLSCSFRA